MSKSKIPAIVAAAAVVVAALGASARVSTYHRSYVTPPAANRQAFLPSVAVAGDGSVGITYDDFRFNRADTAAAEPLETDHFLARCQVPSASEPDRCAGDWVETRITPSSFDLRAAPQAGGLFLGDYFGLSAFGSGFGTLFSQANTAADPASVYFDAVP